MKDILSYDIPKRKKRKKKKRQKATNTGNYKSVNKRKNISKEAES